jgi:hypothetical protein
VLNVYDRVRETSVVSGTTSPLTLLGAAQGYRSFSVVGDGQKTYYCIAHQTASEWETGIAVYTASGTTLTRAVILASSNSGSIVNFSAGTKDVFLPYPADLAQEQVVRSFMRI